MLPPRAALLALSFCALSCGRSDGTRPRPVTLVSRERRVDSALAEARRLALAGEYEDADEQTRALLRRSGGDPVAPLAWLLLSRVLIARGEVDEARRVAEHVDISSDRVLRARRELSLGVVAARQGRLSEVAQRLGPLEGTLTDRAETAELSCALAERASTESDLRGLMRALSVIEQTENDGVSWVATGLRCEDTAARARMVTDAAARATEPRSLAEALDMLPDRSSLRRALAERLFALAQARGETSQWLRYLADLPDDRATQDTQGSRASSVAVVGVIAPTAGSRASVGATIVRSVQFALDGYVGVRVAIEPEGTTPEECAAAVDRLAAIGARAIVGPTRDELAPSVAIRAQSAAIELFLLAGTRDVERTGARVHLAVAPLQDRARALADAVRASGTARVVRMVSGPWSDELARSVTDALRGDRVVIAAGLSSVEPRAGELALVVGDVGTELRRTLARASERSPTRWIFDARAAQPSRAERGADDDEDARSRGLWVGLRASAQRAAMSGRWCERAGEAADEPTLLAYEAALNAAARIGLRRTEESGTTAQSAGESALTRGAVPSGDGVAAAFVCPASATAEVRDSGP